MTDSNRTGRLAPVTPATDALFVYGTLRFPRVLTALLGRAPAGHPASLTGWRAAALKDRPYPGLVQVDSAARETAPAASGLVLRGLTAREWRVLDDFEDDAYALQALPLDAPTAPTAPPRPRPPVETPGALANVTPSTGDVSTGHLAPGAPLPRQAWAYVWVAPDQVRADTWEAEVFAVRQLDAYAARLESAGS